MFNKLNALILTIADFVLSEAIDTKRGPRVFIFFRSSCLELRANDSSSLSVGFRPITSRALYFFLVTESVVFFLDNFNF